MPERDSRGRFVKGSGRSFTFDDRDLRLNLNNLGPQVDGYVHAVCDYSGTNALGYAKRTAPWRDRTGNARNGLSLDVEWEPMVRHAIVLFHRVTYGVFLETRWAGRFAIIIPTVRKYGPETMRLLDKLFRKLKTRGVIP